MLKVYASQQTLAIFVLGYIKTVENSKYINVASFHWEPEKYLILLFTITTFLLSRKKIKTLLKLYSNVFNLSNISEIKLSTLYLLKKNYLLFPNNYVFRGNCKWWTAFWFICCRNPIYFVATFNFTFTWACTSKKKLFNYCIST